MCQTLFGSADVHPGRVDRICADLNAVDHLIEMIAPVDDTQVLSSVLSAYVQGGANLVVIENRYFDIDFRSEFARTHSTSFRVRYAEVARIHFFYAPADAIDPIDHLRDLIVNLAELDTAEYLGYFVLRPRLAGSVGRAMICPPKTSEVLRAGVDLRTVIRTIAAEPIQLFGVELLAIGIPFMEQDGHLLRCAHVSAWICQYSAALRGVTGRLTTGQVHDLSRAASVGQYHPSSGLTAESMIDLLASMGLPAEILDLSALSGQRAFSWADRTALRDDIEDLEHDARQARASYEEAASSNLEPESEFLYNLLTSRERMDSANRELKTAWVRENVASTICQYLNSSTPSILVRQAMGHTQVVIGYIRNEDRNPVGGQLGSPSQVTAFIVSDDMKGPFEIVETDTLVDELMAQETTVLVPLPRALLLSSDAAEQTALKWLGDPTLYNDVLITSGVELDGLLKELADGVGILRGDRFRVRTYWVLSRDFKIDAASDSRFGMNADTVRAIGETQMPRYVWVAEVLDRQLKGAAYAVVATLILDGSEVAANGVVASDVVPLFVHLPGWAKVHDIFGLGRFDRDGDGRTWFASIEGPYSTGRWSLDWPDNYTPSRIAARLKAAGTD